jgi:3-oxoacyl-[acyl-carrier protein] reductase
MSELTGKVAIVTGASKGIGAAIAKRLAAAGASVVVNYASSREGADRVVAEIAGKAGKAIAVKADVSKAADVQRLFDAAKKAFGFANAVQRLLTVWWDKTVRRQIVCSRRSGS